MRIAVGIAVVALAGAAYAGWRWWDGRDRAWILPYRYTGPQWTEWLENRFARNPPERVERHGPSALVRYELSEKDTWELLPSRDQGYTIHDDWTYLAYEPGIDQPVGWADHPRGGYRLRTNALGMREDDEPAEPRPNVRVLVTGDSHTDGVCSNAESYANRMERYLGGELGLEGVEVLNAGKGGFSFYSYLGTLEKYLALEPDVFVVCVYGGNDFAEILALQHFFERTEKPVTANEFPGRIQKAMRRDSAAVSQAYYQLAYFAEVPDEAERALRGGLAVLDEIARICEREEIAFVLAYLPPFSDVEGCADPALVADLAGVLELDEDDLGITDALADRLLAGAAERGWPAVDLRPTLTGLAEPPYWEADHHLDIRGHVRVSYALAPVVAEGIEE